MKITNNYLNKLFSDTISILEKTGINPVEAKKVAREIRSYLKVWSIFFKGTQGKDFPDTLKNNQDLLFENLMAVCILLFDRINPEEAGMNVYRDTIDLLVSIQNYAKGALHEISWPTLVKVYETFFVEKDFKAELEMRGKIHVAPLRLMATVRGDSVFLDPSSPERENIVDDKEYLTALIHSDHLWRQYDSNRVAQIIQKMVLADEKGELIEDEDLDTLAVVSMRYLLGLTSFIISPVSKNMIRFALQNGLALPQSRIVNDVVAFYRLYRKKKFQADFFEEIAHLDSAPSGFHTIADDSEYLEKMNRSNDVLLPEDMARISGIIKKIVSKEKGEPTKDIDALTAIVIPHLLDVVLPYIYPQLKDKALDILQRGFDGESRFFDALVDYLLFLEKRFWLGQGSNSAPAFRAGFRPFVKGFIIWPEKTDD